MATENTEEVNVVVMLTREHLDESHKQLQAGELVLEAKSDWEALYEMARAVAAVWTGLTTRRGVSRGNEPSIHRAFTLTGKDLIRLLQGRAHMLRVASESPDLLNQDAFREDLRNVAKLLDSLELLHQGIQRRLNRSFRG